MVYFHTVIICSSSTDVQQCVFSCLALIPQICENFFLSVDLLIIICSVLKADVNQKLLTCGGSSNAAAGG